MNGSLLELQKRMAAAVMEPLTAQESTRRIRKDGVAMESEAAGFIKPNADLTSLERLEIYNRQYWFRLYSSFEDDFPGLLAVLGRKTFERVMRAYLEACPSTSFSLRDLGSRLYVFLRDNEALTGPKSGLAQEVVRVEWAHIEAYDAATVSPFPPESFASISDATILGLQPSVRLLDLSYPADELLIAMRQDAGSSDTSSNNATAVRKISAVRRVAQLRPDPVWLAVHRQEFTVYYKRLRLEEYRMLTAIQSGAPLGEVFARAFSNSLMDETEQAALLQECFEQWAALGWLCAPQNSGRHSARSGDDG
jgi:hypothetical protein